MFGAVAGFLPIRLGGDATNGWTAAQHARLAADLVAINRTLPLARFSFTKSGATVTITSYWGRNGAGLAYAPTPSSIGTGHSRFTWSLPGWDDDYGVFQPFAIQAARGGANVGSSPPIDCNVLWSGATVDVYTATHTGDVASAASDAPASVTLWGTLGDSATRAIGDYAGDPDKRDSETEGESPYAEAILRELQAQRGSAYSAGRTKYVDCENLALARFWSAVGPRNAEKARANFAPATSDERLPYWEEFLAVPFAPTDPKWRRRQQLAIHYPVSEGPTIDVLRTRLQEMLGSLFVDVTTTWGTDLATPPTYTYWPGINPGPSDADLGGGCWSSERDRYVVTVQSPSGMSDADFLQLVNVQMFRFLDNTLPATSTFSWGVAGGFYLDVSRLDFGSFS